MQTYQIWRPRRNKDNKKIAQLINTVTANSFESAMSLLQQHRGDLKIAKVDGVWYSDRSKVYTSEKDCIKGT